MKYARLFEQDGQAGWLTTALSRPRVLEQMERLLGEGAESVMSARLLREMKTFVRDARGRTGAAQGQHDDLVMAMGIATGSAGTCRSGGSACGACSWVRSLWSLTYGGAVGAEQSADPALVQDDGIASEAVRIAGRRRRVAVLAVQQIRAMRGGAQSQLMLGSDGNLWVVKFQNNPQHTRVLANEYLATRLAASVGLTVPACEVVEVTEWLIANTPELLIQVPGWAGALPGGAAFRVAICGRADAGAGGGLRCRRRSLRR